MSLISSAFKSTRVRSSLHPGWPHTWRFKLSPTTAFWLLGNLFDTLTTLIGFARGHVELNRFAVLLGQALGTYAMFLVKWLVVAALIWFAQTTRRRPRLNYCLTRTMRISTVILWLGVCWNLVMLRYFG